MPTEGEEADIHQIRAVKWFYHLMAIAGILLFVMWQTATIMFTGRFNIDVGLYSVSVLLVGAGFIGSLLYREHEKEAMAARD